MYPRRCLIEIFSTFLQLDGDRCQGWITDPQLRRSMNACLKQIDNAPTSDQFWAIYWHKIWLSASSRLAIAHLSAYLQETCYWISHKTLSCFVSPRYQMSDCFQIAIAATPKILKRFNPQRCPSLKDYASVAFKSIIRDTLRSSQEVDICTDWALLRKLSKKRLVESLERAGFSPETIAHCQLAWTCFKTLYLPTQETGTRRLNRPDRATWEAIAERYNRDRQLYLDSPCPECSPETLEQCLLQCAKLARDYLYPPRTSIDEPRSSEGYQTLLDHLPSEVDESALEQLLEREEAERRQQQRSQIESMLSAGLSQLKPQSQALLQLYYSQELTQQEIAAQHDLKQYQVSRQLARARESLLKIFAQWSQQTLHITLTSDVLNNASKILEEWLQGYYSVTGDE
jgi:RNA polymerase sigma factor (sigma-70 family)